MLQALIWDVDGTLAETERDGHRLAFNAAFQAHGLPWQWSVDHYGRLLHVTGGRERLLRDMAMRPTLRASLAEREQLAVQLHQRKNRIYAAMVRAGRLQPRPGVLALIEAARSAGLRQAIATTTSRSNVEALLGCLLGRHWESYFDAIVCGEDVSRKKPDPEVYQIALQRLQLQPGQALALEDSEPGWCAARAAGLAVLLTPSVYFPAPPQAAQHDRASRSCSDLGQASLSALQSWVQELASHQGDSRVLHQS